MSSAAVRDVTRAAEEPRPVLCASESLTPKSLKDFWPGEEGVGVESWIVDEEVEVGLVV